jgi:hypothetical protein
MADAIHHNPIGHEEESTDIRAVGWTGIALAIGVGIVFIMVSVTFQLLLNHRPKVYPANPMAETGQQQFPPFPRLEEHSTNEVIQLHQHEDKILSTYGWMDKKAGVVRIPIDRAMELQLSRGFPTRKEAVTK